MENLDLFFLGVKDSLRIPRALLEILSSLTLLRKTLQCVIFNGVIYLGSVVLFSFFLHFFDSPDDTSLLTYSNVLVVLVKLIVGLVYNGWLFIIYIMAMTLTTYWAQDIFDELLVIQLEKLENTPDVKRNPGKYLKKLQNLEPKLSAKEKGIDLIQRTIIISIYLLITSVITLLVKLVLGKFISGITEIFLYSILHAYYCYEYKTSAMDLDVITSIAYFEEQWSYFTGFGFVFTIILYFWKQVGSSLFFLFFPLMVVISMDLEG